MSFSRHSSLLLLQAVLLSGGLGALGAVLGTALLAVGHADRIQCAAHYVVAHSGQILHTATADEHDGVLLQVVADAGNVGGDFHTIGQANAGDLTQRRVRLLGGLRVDAGADAAPLGRTLHGRRSRLVARRNAAFSHELTKCRQTLTP